MLKRIILLLAVSLAAVAAAPIEGAPDAVPPLRVGFFDDVAFRWQANRHANLDLARREGATIVRTLVDWSQVAPRRPRRPADPFDRAYRLDDLNELVRDAQQRGIDVLLTIWGTPAWANGGAGKNVAPADPQDFADFAHALAARYSGRYVGFPLVRFFSVWNEPNSAVFLKPQFDAAGRPVAPRIYASLVAAAYRGIKSASPAALVGAGETAPRGYDRRVAGFHDSESPARFAQLVAAAAPRLPFDAWAHHPYPRSDLERPGAPQSWPAVGLASLGVLQARLDRWFGRRDLPLWVTEFAYRTSPPTPGALSYDLQASYLLQALALARTDPSVDMFVWFGFRDSHGQRWESGLVDRGGRPKPALASFALAAHCGRLTLHPCTQEGAKLTASGEVGAGSFGTGAGLSADGRTALVGGSTDNGGVGAAWVFTRSGAGWTQQGPKLTAVDGVGPGRLGGGVALSADGGTALLGGSGDDGGAGAAWVFERAADSWTQQGPKLTPADANGSGGFGGRVALSGDGNTALVGAAGDASGLGAAWVFRRSGGTWTQDGPRLTPSDEKGLGRFGVRVALSADGNTALIAGWNDDGNRGAAWVFTRSGGGWVQQGPKLTPSDQAGAASFGGGVALSADGDTAMIGAEDDGGSVGAAWVFVRSGAVWTQEGPKLTASGETGRGAFGRTVTLSASGDTALVGGSGDHDGVGAAWVFARSGSAWTQVSKLTARDEAGAGMFGRTIALNASGDIALIGGFGDAGNVGAAWIFVNWPAAAPGTPSRATPTAG